MEYTFRIRYFKSDNCKVLSTLDKEWEYILAPWGSTDVYCEAFTIFYFYLNKMTTYVTTGSNFLLQKL